MKTILLIILNVLIVQLIIGQTKKAIEPGKDPFCRMIETIYSLDALRFNSQYSVKQLFETDTITTYAKVLVKKNGTAISFLQIIPEEGDNELLFCNDSAWDVDHLNNKMICIGTTTGNLAKNGMSKFFSFTLFEIDTMISQVVPFWRIIGQSEKYTVVSLDMNNSAEELSDNRVEFTIRNSDILPEKIVQEAVYLKVDKYFQEQTFNGYSFPSPDQVKVPEYFDSYKKDLSIMQKKESVVESAAEDSLEEVFLEIVELFDLEGKPFNLPRKGLIFLDCWYVGCSPCIKSAPVIEKLYVEYKDRVFFFSVNEIDRDTAKIARFKEKMNISFPVLLGGKVKLASKITGSGGYPVFILMDGQSGKLLWKMEGYSENLEEIISSTIEKNL